MCLYLMAGEDLYREYKDKYMESRLLRTENTTTSLGPTVQSRIHSYQAKVPNILWFQSLRCENTLCFFVISLYRSVDISGR